MSEVEVPTPTVPTIAEQIKTLITDVDARISAEREDFKVFSASHQGKMKALLSERREITAAIQGVRRRVAAKVKKTKVKKVEVAA